MNFHTLKWQGEIDGSLELIDQRKLPLVTEYFTCSDTQQLFDAIRTLAVRGAPAIGVAAGYGLVLGLQKASGKSTVADGLSVLKESAEYLAQSRPTAVNLFWAIERVVKVAEKFAADNPDANIEMLRQCVLDEARRIEREDIEMCLAIGKHGAPFIHDGDGILTHCNAGALATAGQGTALSVMFEAHKAGKQFRVYSDETRPLLQGARLTAWELQQAGIEVAVICDNMAGFLMKQGKIDAVITGADRIAANGDAANKIGTCSLSILAAHHGIPFYIAAPSSTFDLSIAGGSDIVIEQRKSEEVTHPFGTQTAPEGVDVENPAFDVTDAEHIAAIITEHGVIESPNREKIRKQLGN